MARVTQIAGLWHDPGLIPLGPFACMVHYLQYWESVRYSNGNSLMVIISILVLVPRFTNTILHMQSTVEQC
jgi:hypothetical protein